MTDILHLVLKKEWFDLIAAGEKKEEYRQLCEYWRPRLEGRSYDFVIFRNGYRADSPRVKLECLGIRRDTGRPEWGAKPGELYYVVSLGKIIPINPPLEITPITFWEASKFVIDHHRHLPKAPQGHKFSIAVSRGEKVVGVAMIGRPIARHQDDGWTLEVNRCCTDGSKNACSKLYAAAWRAARAMGYRRLITYVLEVEPGVSMRAAGFRLIGQTKGGAWNREARPRIDGNTDQKSLWEKSI